MDAAVVGEPGGLALWRWSLVWVTHGGLALRAGLGLAAVLGGFPSIVFTPSRPGFYRPFQGSLGGATVPTAEAVGY
jgi:hypothetical protein